MNLFGRIICFLFGHVWSWIPSAAHMESDTRECYQCDKAQRWSDTLMRWEDENG